MNYFTFEAALIFALLLRFFSKITSYDAWGLGTEYAPVIFPVTGIALRGQRAATVHGPGTRCVMAGEVSIERLFHVSRYRDARQKLVH